MLSKKERQKLEEIKEKFNISNDNTVRFLPNEFQLYRSMLTKLEQNDVINFVGLTLDGSRHYVETGSIEVFEKEELEDELEQNEVVKLPKHGKTYDVFISHANKDKSEYVDKLVAVIRNLGINVFYDTDVLSWGDNWKDMLLSGTAQSEFAIIVISENFFGREWTERELSEFLKRQNASGQKIVLPLLHNITVDDLKREYPEVADIQAIDTATYSKEEIAILFAKELIKRLKGI